MNAANRSTKPIRITIPTERLNIILPQNRNTLFLGFLAIFFGIVFALPLYQLPLIGILIFLPTVWLSWPKRCYCFLFILSFYLALNWEEIPDALKFFASEQISIATAFSIWISHSLLMSLPWVIVYSKNRKLVNLLPRALLLTLLLFVPPLGYFIWMQPITCAGILFPGFGWIGLSLAILLMLTLLALRFSQGLLSSTKKCLIFLTTAMLLLSLYANLNYQTPLAPKSWIAINTHLGPAPQNYFSLAQREFILIGLTQQALDHGKKVIVFPENIVADWLPGTQSQWQAILHQVKDQNANIILGAQLDHKDQSHDNVLIVLSKAANRICPARQPMPFGLWRPWSRDNYHAHWFSSGKFSLQGHVVAYLICYEEMLPWPIFSSFMMKPYPDVIISIANQWFAIPSGYLKQKNIMLANARLFKLSVLTAVNR